MDMADTPLHYDLSSWSSSHTILATTAATNMMARSQTDTAQHAFVGSAVHDRPAFDCHAQQESAIILALT